jgi:hypothetical protein
MTKLEALKYLQAHADYQGGDDQALIGDAIADREKAPKGEVKVKATKVIKPSLDAIKERGKVKVSA